MALGNWTSTWQAASSDATTIGSTDDIQNETKLFVQERGVVEHDWGAVSLGSGLSDTGRHKPGAARAFYQNTTPQRLRLFDNSGEDPASGADLGSDDDGRLWVNFDANNKLRVWNGSAWGDVAAVPPWPGEIDVTSVDASAIAASTYVTLASWSSTPRLITPAEGQWRAIITARVYITNSTGSNDRLCRVELRDGTSILDVDEQTIRSNDGGNDGYTAFNLNCTFAAVASTTYTFDVRAQTSGTNLSYGGGAIISSGDAANRNHIIQGWLVPVG